MEKLKLFVNNLDKKQKILSIVALSLLGVFFIVVIIGCLLPKPTSEPDGEDNSSLVVDYSQTVTNVDGSSFDGSVKVSSSEQYAIRFPNLVCKDGCKNVSSVKLGDQLLKNGLDYEVKEGSVIIVLLKRLLTSLKTGDYNLTFEYNDGETTKRIGVNIKIENETPTCNEDQVLTDGECVAKEQPGINEDSSSPNASNVNGSDDNGNSNSNSNNSGNNSSSGGDNNSSNNDNSGSNNNTPQNPDNTTPTTPDTPSAPDTPVTPEEPTPSEPEEPETPVHTAEFNLNDGYKINYFGVHIYSHDDNGEPLKDENGELIDSFTYGSCEIMKDSAVIKKTYFTSNGSNIPFEQQEAERAAAEARGLSGEGGGYIVDLTEQFCGICGVSCDRW